MEYALRAFFSIILLICFITGRFLRSKTPRYKKTPTERDESSKDIANDKELAKDKRTVAYFGTILALQLSFLFCYLKYVDGFAFSAVSPALSLHSFHLPLFRLLCARRAQTKRFLSFLIKQLEPFTATFLIIRNALYVKT